MEKSGKGVLLKSDTHLFPFLSFSPSKFQEYNAVMVSSDSPNFSFGVVWTS